MNPGSEKTIEPTLSLDTISTSESITISSPPRVTLPVEESSEILNNNVEELSEIENNNEDYRDIYTQRAREVLADNGDQIPFIETDFDSSLIRSINLNPNFLNVRMAALWLRVVQTFHLYV